jgi:LmbE family N-acetylglucosaminyl deacetylase
MHSFVDFGENSVMSSLNEIFRRFNAHFATFYTKNVVHTALFVGTGPAASKTQSFADFDENSVISSLIEIFRRFKDHFTPFTRRA